MPTIRLETHISAPIHIVFDLARSIDLHKITTAHTNEDAVAGKTSGLIGPGESVTWKARHFGMSHLLTSEITAYERPDTFTDEMIKGPFKSMSHKHSFWQQDDVTIMNDVFEYESPFGILGRLADGFLLEGYMEDLLRKRTEMIKEYAEDKSKYSSILNL